VVMLPSLTLQVMCCSLSLQVIISRWCLTGHPDAHVNSIRNSVDYDCHAGVQCDDPCPGCCLYYSPEHLGGLSVTNLQIVSERLGGFQSPAHKQCLQNLKIREHVYLISHCLSHDYCVEFPLVLVAACTLLLSTAGLCHARSGTYVLCFAGCAMVAQWCVCPVVCRVFIEETSLVARPAVGFDELKARLQARLEWLGIKVGTERVHLHPPVCIFCD
jgi:hypothetical protein